LIVGLTVVELVMSALRIASWAYSWVMAGAFHCGGNSWAMSFDLQVAFKAHWVFDFTLVVLGPGMV
jgi:hypothetical protein